MFLVAIFFKSFVFVVGLNPLKKTEFLPENKLPIYTILIPLYREEKTLPGLIEAIKNIDYPKSKLDVKLVVEADDEVTICGLKKIPPPAYMEIIRVPYSIPRTKPKACNYALRYTRGEYVTIYDAEDIPETMQLKKVIAKFLAADEKLACVQARLDYFNYNENQIARWFTLEYGIWFGAVMRGFVHMKMPIPLGGTSNHVRTKTLREVGGWDAFNVTEDADLGMRLAQFGYHTDVIDSVTMEEAAFRLPAWISQRTRWLKGFIQTYFVCMQNPIKLIKRIGFTGFLGFQFFVGLPPLIYISVLPLLVAGFYFSLSNLQYNIASLNFICGALTHIIFSLIISYKLFHRKLFFSALTFPLYTLLSIVAAYKAVWQLVRNPYHWDKTEHGVTKVKI